MIRQPWQWAGEEQNRYEIGPVLKSKMLGCGRLSCTQLSDIIYDKSKMDQDPHNTLLSVMHQLTGAMYSIIAL